jgi:hypothetical protein
MTKHHRISSPTAPSPNNRPSTVARTSNQTSPVAKAKSAGPRIVQKQFRPSSIGIGNNTIVGPNVNAPVIAPTNVNPAPCKPSGNILPLPLTSLRLLDF